MLRQVLDVLQIPCDIDHTKCPDSDNKLLIIPQIYVPIYGQLLVGEQALLKKIEEKLHPFIIKINNLLKAIGNPASQDLDSLVSQLQMGAVAIKTYKTMEIDYDKMGYPVLKDLADRAGVALFNNTSPIIDGLVSTELLDIFSNYADTWFNNNIPGDTVLDMANAVLDKSTVLVQDSNITVKQIDVEKTLKEVGLTWGDLQVLQESSSPYFTSLLLIYFRTGIIDFNPLEFLTLAEADNVAEKLISEIKGAKAIDEPVVANSNHEKQTQAASGSNPLKSEPTTSTPKSRKPKNVSETDK
jgi:hypothetical protein